jgi:hypothetical protein
MNKDEKTHTIKNIINKFIFLGNNFYLIIIEVQYF